MLNLNLAGAAARGLVEVVPKIWRIMRSLFLEVMGFLFLAVAAWGLLGWIRLYREFQGEGEAVFKMVLVGGFILMMGSFGVSSFFRARRISRDK